MDVSYFFEFSILCKHDNFSEAARELHISQPALSRHVKSIEKEFGITLFERTATPIELTPIGEIFLRESCRMVSQYAKLKGIILTAKKNPRIVKISGLTESICSIYIQKVKEALRKSHPEIHPKLFDVDYQNTFDSLRDNRFDIGFEPYSELAEVDDLNSIPIAKEQAFLIVEKNSHFAEKDCVNFAEIECLDFVTIRNNAGFALRKHIQSACHRRGLHGAIPNEFILSQGKDHGSLLLEGLGGMATMLPESLVQSHHPIFKERYCAIPIVDNDLYYDFRIFWKESASKEVLLYIKTLESVMTSPLVQPTASTASTPSTPSPDLNPENTTG